jgi:hypothetical protein
VWNRGRCRAGIYGEKLTVCYSWQSDTPPNLNRSFIEKAIQEALNRLKSDAKLEAAFRDATIELDKDRPLVTGLPKTSWLSAHP